MDEQMGKLTALLKDERRSHQNSCRALLEEAERRAERVRQQQQQEMAQLMRTHKSEISAMVALHTKTQEEERCGAEERYALLEKDYDFLKSSFRTYKDSISEEMRSSWLRKEASWKEEQETLLLDQLTEVCGELKKSDQEKEKQRKAFESKLVELQNKFEKDLQVR
ncbi:flagellum-associated coiled-coil domain-containing protein 1-like [Aplochiton taeniatus]